MTAKMTAITSTNASAMKAATTAITASDWEAAAIQVTWRIVSLRRVRPQYR